MKLINFNIFKIIIDINLNNNSFSKGFINFKLITYSI